ncbi:hypothetical protein LZ568_08875 [Burkholderia cepacia]|nr:hypothetical protein LZ568_08875 [Burkholderia cepacia]
MPANLPGLPGTVEPNQAHAGADRFATQPLRQHRLAVLLRRVAEREADRVERGLELDDVAHRTPRVVIASAWRVVSSDM